MDAINADSSAKMFASFALEVDAYHAITHKVIIWMKLMVYVSLIAEIWF